MVSQVSHLCLVLKKVDHFFKDKTYYCLFVVLECGKLGEFSIVKHVFLFLLLFFFLKSQPLC